MLHKLLYTGFIFLSFISYAKEDKTLSDKKEPTKTVAAPVKDKDKDKAIKTDKKAPAKAVRKLEIGKKAPNLPVSTKKLSYVSKKKAWTVKSMENKLSVLFYVAPSEKDLNRHVTDAIKAAKISRDYYSSFAVINMAASGWPNFIIAMKLNKSQKEFPATTYVKDYKKVLVKEWGLKDKSNDVLLFDTDGKLLFRYDGKVPKDEVTKLVTMLKNKAAQVAKAQNTKKDKTLASKQKTAKVAVKTNETDKKPLEVAHTKKPS